MRGGQNGEFGSGRLGCRQPLVRVQFDWIENVVVFHRFDAVIALIVNFPVKHMQIIVENHPHFRFMPFELVGGRNGYIHSGRGLAAGEEWAEKRRNNECRFFHLLG